MLPKSRRLRKMEDELRSARKEVVRLREQSLVQIRRADELEMGLRAQRSYVEAEIATLLTYLGELLEHRVQSINTHWAEQLQQRGDAMQQAINTHWAEQLQQRGDAMQQALNTHWAEQLQQRGDAMQQALNTHWAEQLQQRGDAMQQALSEEMLRHRDNIDIVIKTLVTRLNLRVEREMGENIPVSTNHGHIDPLLYTYFEDQFRGSFDLITQRQQKLVRALVDFAGPPGRWLDIGSGRGELLGILNDSGIEALGLEPNEFFVSECRSRGLEVVQASTADLRALDLGGYFDVISMMQVGEHLDIGELVACIHQVSNRLTPGGMVILEFPNICNPSVMTADFWLDPTHLRPLHPKLVEFILIYTGLPPIPHHNGTELGTLIWSSSEAADGQDALIIGKKPRHQA
jgi:hypothetical protein